MQNWMQNLHIDCILMIFFIDDKGKWQGTRQHANWNLIFYPEQLTTEQLQLRANLLIFLIFCYWCFTTDLLLLIFCYWSFAVYLDIVYLDVGTNPFYLSNNNFYTMHIFYAYIFVQWTMTLTCDLIKKANWILRHYCQGLGRQLIKSTMHTQSFFCTITDHLNLSCALVQHLQHLIQHPTSDPTSNIWLHTLKL